VKRRVAKIAVVAVLIVLGYGVGVLVRLGWRESNDTAETVAGDSGAGRPTGSAPAKSTHPRVDSAERAVPGAGANGATGPTPLLLHLVDARTGKPVRDAEVELVTVDERARAEPAEDGFRLLLPPRGAARIRVSAPGYIVADVDRQLLSPPEDTLGLVPEESLLVRCLSSETMMPVPGASVRFATLNAPVSLEPAAATDLEGYAELTPAALVSRPGAGRDDMYAMELTAAAAGFLEKTVKVSVDPATSWNDLQVLLDPSWTLTVQVLDPSGEHPVARASVVDQWDHGGRGILNADARVFKTDDEGIVELALRKDASQVQILAVHPDYAPTGVVLEPARFLETMRVTIELSSGQVVEGVVVDEEGEPVPQVLVDLDPRERADFTDWMRYAAWKSLGGAPDMTATGADGRFLFPRVAPGEYSVQLVHSDYSPDPANSLLVVDAAEDATWLGVVETAVTLTGRVVDDSGAAIAGMAITLRPRERAANAPPAASKVVRTDAGGWFTAKGLSRCAYEVIFHGGPGFGTRTDTIDAETLPQPWGVVLERRWGEEPAGDGELWLRVEDDGLHLADAEFRVRLARIDDAGRESTRSGHLRGGELRIAGLLPGIYRAVVAVEGFAPLVVPELVVEPEPESPLTVEAVRGVRVFCEVAGLERPARLVVRDAHSKALVSSVPIEATRDAPRNRVALRVEPGVYALGILPRCAAPESLAEIVVDVGQSADGQTVAELVCAAKRPEGL